MKRLLLILSVMALIAVPMTIFAQNNDDSLYVTEDGVFAVSLPEGWLADGDVQGLFVASSAEALELIHDDSEVVPALPSGEVGLIVAPFPLEAFEFFGIAPDASTTEILEAFLEFDEETIPVGEITEVEVRGLPAATVQITQETGDVVIIIHQLGPDVVGLTGVVTGDDTFDAIMEDVVAGLNDVNFGLPLEELYEDETISVMYPAGWNAEVVEDELIVTNVPESLEEGSDDLQSNDVVYILGDVTQLVAEYDGDLEATAVATIENELAEGDVLGELSTVVVDGREVVGLNITNEIDGEVEGGFAITEGPDGQFYGILYVTADNEGPLVAWTGVQILLSINSTDGIEG